MISRYKVKIISLYIGLLFITLMIVFILLYTILGYQLHKEIDTRLVEKVKWVNRVLKEIECPPESSREFFESIVYQRRHYPDFWNIRKLTDVSDDRYILFVFMGNRLMYLTRRYREYKDSIKPFSLKMTRPSTIMLSGTPFSLCCIDKLGYKVYLGCRLTTIYNVKRRIVEILFIVFPIGIILSIICGYFVTQSSLSVIDNINRTAARITSKNLHERIKIPKGRDEITNLIVTLNSMIDRLEKSFNTVQQFSHDAAHEIRTPLTIIQGEIEELLKDEKCPDNVVITLESILEEMHYLSSIANKLLMINDIDTGRINYDFTRIHLDKIVKETFEDAKILSASKRLKIELKKLDRVQISGNEELLIRLLWNVIDNAIKYTEPGGRVSIGLEKKRSEVIIWVKDSGVGIPSEDIDKIFDRFYRVDKSRSRELGGSGLGLAIAKWIVDVHNGRIDVESSVGEGSVFKIVLPLDSRKS